MRTYPPFIDQAEHSAEHSVKAKVNEAIGIIT